MSRGLNKVMIIGNLGQDPEIKYLPNGTAIANVTVATSESWKDKNTGEQIDKTEWHRVVFYRRLAEIVGEYLKKGSKIYIEGKLQTRKWQDKNGKDNWTTEVIASEMQMLDSRGGNSGNASPSQNSAPAQSAPQQATSSSSQGSPMGGNDEDDIPFQGYEFRSII